MYRIALSILLLLAGCGQPQSEPAESSTPTAAAPADTSAAAHAQTEQAAAAPEQRRALFGDLHVHTFYSFDAFLFGTRATPDDAYRYARGEAIKHPAGFDVQLKKPLDFYAVTDHAMFLGNLPAWADGTAAKADHPVAKAFATARTIAERQAAFQGMFPYLQTGKDNELLDLDLVRSAWQDIREAAERNNDPGHFTTFVAYEYTSGPEQQNLHRNVIFRGSEAPDTPFSRLDSMNPEDLWTWMDNLRDQGMEALAIPHNSNGSNGQMFALVDWAGNPLDADYAEKRMRNEPLVEITQIKGTSDTHPLLSPNDEWADFEIMPYRIASWLPSEPHGSYVREALLNGITLEATQGFNPFQFGLVGASDTHTAAASEDESNFFSKVGLLDATPQQRGSVPLDKPLEDGSRYANVYYNTWGTAGVTGVWADENERGAIYDAFRRKETFATTGPRMIVRLFAGFDLPENLDRDPDMVRKAYARGVPMGDDLLPGEGAPRFVATALRDPDSAPLQRLQIIKGWVDNGEPHEQVYDVACSDGLQVDPATHRCPDNGASVDLATCAISADAGAAELSATWQDPDFDPGQQAFYYVRVLENPTCRWSTWDAVRAGVAPREDMHATIQERAWSSPIWYHPQAGDDV
ncbi:MAG: DUF3604 domain-containing protein [Pseudomonadales bacterium]